MVETLKHFLSSSSPGLYKDFHYWDHFWKELQDQEDHFSLDLQISVWTRTGVIETCSGTVSCCPAHIGAAERRARSILKQAECPATGSWESDLNLAGVLFRGPLTRTLLSSFLHLGWSQKHTADFLTCEIVVIIPALLTSKAAHRGRIKQGTEKCLVKCVHIWQRRSLFSDLFCH